MIGSYTWRMYSERSRSIEGQWALSASACRGSGRRASRKGNGVHAARSTEIARSDDSLDITCRRTTITCLWRYLCNASREDKNPATPAAVVDARFNKRAEECAVPLRLWRQVGR